MANRSAGGGVTPQWQSALQGGGGAVMQRSASGGGGEVLREVLDII